MLTRYLLDAVALLKMSPQQRASAFVRDYCRAPGEIVWEARLLPDHDVLEAITYDVTVAVLEQLPRVMAAADPLDDPLDLFHNKGNGDALLLATALTEIDGESDSLVPFEWTVVTDDGALGRLAARLGVPTLSVEGFLQLLR